MSTRRRPGRVGSKRSTYRIRSRELLLEYMDGSISVRELAARTDVSPAMVQHLRDGTKQTCSQGLAERIEEVLGIKPGALFAPVVSTDRLTVSRKTGDRAA
jgi:hypothetical protein